MYEFYKACSYIQCISNIARQIALAFDVEFNLIYKYSGVAPVLNIHAFFTFSIHCLVHAKIKIFAHSI